MPLIIMSGRPSTGKTTRAQELEKYFRETCQKTTHLINEETLLIDKKEGYQGIHFTILLLNLPPLVPFWFLTLATDNFREKNTRSSIKAAVERFLTRDVVVICDSLNYIKGYRYELYCIARALRTTHCVVILPSISWYFLLSFLLVRCGATLTLKAHRIGIRRGKEDMILACEFNPFPALALSLTFRWSQIRRSFTEIWRTKW